jgi:8-oxo-dGTP diphosphatase
MHTFGIAVKALIYNQGKYLILYKSQREEINPESYDIPGGRLVFGETSVETLTREVREEVGIDVKPQVITECWSFIKADFQLVGITYLCIAESIKIHTSKEHTSHQWADIEEIKQPGKYPEWLVQSVSKAEEMRRLIDRSYSETHV